MAGLSFSLGLNLAPNTPALVASAAFQFAENYTGLPFTVGDMVFDASPRPPDASAGAMVFNTGAELTQYLEGVAASGDAAAVDVMETGLVAVDIVYTAPVALTTGTFLSFGADVSNSDDVIAFGFTSTGIPRVRNDGPSGNALNTDGPSGTIVPGVKQLVTYIIHENDAKDTKLVTMYLNGIPVLVDRAMNNDISTDFVHMGIGARIGVTPTDYLEGTIHAITVRQVSGATRHAQVTGALVETSRLLAAHIAGFPKPAVVMDLEGQSLAGGTTGTHPSPVTVPAGSWYAVEVNDTRENQLIEMDAVTSGSGGGARTGQATGHPALAKYLHDEHGAVLITTAHWQSGTNLLAAGHPTNNYWQINGPDDANRSLTTSALPLSITDGASNEPPGENGYVAHRNKMLALYPAFDVVAKVNRWRHGTAAAQDLVDDTESELWKGNYSIQALDRYDYLDANGDYTHYVLDGIGPRGSDATEAANNLVAQQRVQDEQTKIFAARPALIDGWAWDPTDTGSTFNTFTVDGNGAYTGGWESVDGTHPAGDLADALEREFAPRLCAAIGLV